MSFHGFTLPDGAWLPPELIYLLPNISGSKLKVVIAILYHNLQVGGGEPLSLTDVEKYTGLSRRAVIDALRDLLEDGIIERQAVGESYLYLPSVKSSLGSVKSSTGSEKITLASLRESESKLINNLIKDSLTDSLTNGSEKITLVQLLRECGVYLRTAQGLVDEHTAQVIEQAIGYYRHALVYNLAQGPGWLVQAIKEEWGEPLGWKSNGAECTCERCLNGRPRTEDRYVSWMEIEGS